MAIYFAPWQDPFACGCPNKGPSDVELVGTLLLIAMLCFAIYLRPC